VFGHLYYGVNLGSVEGVDGCRFEQDRFEIEVRKRPGKGIQRFIRRLPPLHFWYNCRAASICRRSRGTAGFLVITHFISS